MTPRDVLSRSDSRGVGLSGPLLLALVVCLGFLLYLHSQPLGDPDTHMHIAVGHWIFQHRTVPSVDPFSFTMHGAPWVAHEWLAECILAATHELAGWTGLVLLAVASFALSLAWLMRFLLSRVPPIYALLFTVLAAASLSTHLLARPHVLSWPLLLVWLGSLIKAGEQRQSPPWWLLVLMTAWANLHGSFTLGLALVPPLAFEAVLGQPPGQRWRLARAWVVFFGLALLAAMLTPAGWKGIWFTLHLLDLKHLKHIAEWAPATSVTLLPLELWLATLLGLALTGYLRLPAVRLLLLLGLLHQALMAGRYISIFGAITPLLIATPFGIGYRTRATEQAHVSALDRFFERMRVPAKPRAVLFATVLVLLTAWGTSRVDQHVPESSKTPAAAVDAALRAGAGGHVLNTYDFGGYLIARGIPVFIDGRADLYGDQHIERYLEALFSNKPEKIQRVLDDFGIAWTLLDPSAPIVLYLNGRADWQKVYEDETAIVHLRKTSQ